MSKRLYSQSHEWLLVDDKATVGLSAHAVEELGDIVFVEMPELGAEIKAGEHLLVVESVKTVADVFAPCDLKVLAVNEALDGAPETLNENPLDCWLLEVEICGPVDGLMEEADYLASL